jgi:hypothetical protein
MCVDGPADDSAAAPNRVRAVELRLHAATGLGGYSGRVVAVVRARAPAPLARQSTLLRRLSMTVGAGGSNPTVSAPAGASHTAGCSACIRTSHRHPHGNR